MKKYTIVLLVCLTAWVGLAQENLVDFASVSRPALASYENVPVDYCTGIPNINYGLLNLQTASKDFGFNLSLNYHPSNMVIQQRPGEVGKGWSLLGIPSISKDVIGNESDEYVTFASVTNGTSEHPLYDVYYFNINGETGKFRFVCDTITAAVSLQLLTPTQFKIAFTQTADTSLKISAFTITDTNGIIYYFEKYNMERGDQTTGPTQETRASFFLTRVHDSNNVQLCSLSYQQLDVYSIYDPTKKIKSLNKLSEITATGIGKLKFDYTTNLAYHNKNRDISRLEAISLLTPGNTLVKKCRFNYLSNNSTPGGLSFLDANGAAVENYKFEYNPITYPEDGEYTDMYHQGFDKYGYLKIIGKCVASDRIITSEYANKESVIYGMLKKVVLPSGARIDYEWESNTVDPEGYTTLQPFKTFNLDENFNETLFPGHTFETFTMKPLDPALEEEYVKSNPDNYYLENLGTREYSVEANDLPYFLTMTQDTELYILFDGQGNPSPYIEDPEAQTLAIGYEVRNASSQLMGSFGISKYDAGNCFKMGDKMILPAGMYTIKIIAPFGGYVHYTMFAKRKTAVRKSYYYAAGARIKSIKQYENEISATPVKNLSFEYTDFNDPTRSSGAIYHTAIINNPLVYNGTTAHVLYKNVKVSEGNNGYSKYSFYTPRDFLYITNTSAEWRYYKSLSKGLLHKKQLFDAAGSLLESERNYYVLEPTGEAVDNIDYHLVSNFFVDELSINNYYIQRQFSKIEKNLSGPSPTVLKSLVINNNWNFNPESVITFDSKDKKKKTRYYYINEVPATPNAASLIAKNMIARPLEVGQYYDGTLISKTKSEFGSFGNGLFAKAKTYLAKGAGNYTLEQRVSQMDNVSNKILEVTNDKGTNVSYIWGYNKTLPIAKIENAVYADVQAQVSNLQSLSDTGTEASLLLALNSLRTSLPNAMVTTYTYKPLIGVSTMTDPKGFKTVYEYDAFNRLFQVKDQDGNILSKNQYNYRPN